MIRITIFAGRRVAVFGLGASGNATVAALLSGGTDVAAWDDCEAGRQTAAAAGLPVVDLANADWNSFAALVLAPGVPLTHPKPHWTVEKARASGVEVIGDIELFSRERAKSAPDAPFVAITGTNGKSTTTALIAHLLKASGRDVQLGGNIGRAVLTLELPAPGRYHVIECSSFQIDLAPGISPSVGVLVNVTPDHLDRHGSMENYAAIKERLVGGSATAVVGVDDEYCRAIAKRIGGRLVTISAAGNADIAYCDGKLYRAGQAEPAAHLSGVGSLRGGHNGQNAAAAFAAVSACGLADAEIAKHLRTYPGLAHRMEEVGRLGPVLYVNDSKATNADSSEKALLSWPSDIFWILGGKAKDGGITSLSPYFPRIAKAYLIGAASDAFAATLSGRVEFEKCGTLDHAVAAASRDAGRSTAAEPVVLLSPSCASFDQYRNFEVRGDHFRRMVVSLPGFVARGGAA